MSVIISNGLVEKRLSKKEREGKRVNEWTVETSLQKEPRYKINRDSGILAEG